MQMHTHAASVDRRVVSVKWGKNVYENIEVDSNTSGKQLMAKLEVLTGVPINRQKILGKGVNITINTPSLASTALQNGSQLMLLGTADQIVLKQSEEELKHVEEKNSVSKPESEVNFPCGLVNLGNTCYMNATIQYLRTIPELKGAIKQFNAEIPSFFADDPDAIGNNLIMSLRELFKMLESTDPDTGVQPIFLLNFFRKAYPQFNQKDSHGHFAQQDAEECWVQMMTVLQTKLKDKTVDGNSFSLHDYIAGELTCTLKCDESPDEPITSSKEEFKKLTCHISQEVNFLNQGLKESLNETIEKTSSTLQKLAKYTKSSRISKLPHYLTVHFMRFYWKSTEGVKAKILRKVKYPMSLDVFEFCTPDLQASLTPAREKLHAEEEGKAGMDKRQKRDEINDDEVFLNTDAVACHQTGWYELCAVLTHIGRSADSGHYVCWSCDKKGQWWKYDDDTVSPVQPEDILKLDGGGDWHIAYLCLYREKVWKEKIKENSAMNK